MIGSDRHSYDEERFDVDMSFFLRPQVLFLDSVPLVFDSSVPYFSGRFASIVLFVSVFVIGFLLIVPIVLFSYEYYYDEVKRVVLVSDGVIMFSVACSVLQCLTRWCFLLRLSRLLVASFDLQRLPRG